MSDTLNAPPITCIATACDKEVTGGHGYACSNPLHRREVDDKISAFGSGIPGDQYDLLGA